MLAEEVEGGRVEGRGRWEVEGGRERWEVEDGKVEGGARKRIEMEGV